MGGNEEICNKVANMINVPPRIPGCDALDMMAPMLVQLNPDGQWQSSTPDGLDEDSLKMVVDHLIQSNAVSAARSYCTQCAVDAQKQGGASNYMPVIIMPIYGADQCPFDLDCEVSKMKNAGVKKPDQKGNVHDHKDASGKNDDPMKKPKKRGFVMQRLTDFDLMSQW